jgi:hypothetical protein
MNRDIENLNRFLKECDLPQSNPLEIKKFAIDSRSRGLREILKRSGALTLWFGLVLSIFYITKRIGIPITIVKSKIIAIIFSLSIAGTVAVGGYYTAQKFLPPAQKSLPKEVEDVKKTINEPENGRTSINGKNALHKFYLGIQPFSGEATSVSEKVTMAFIAGLEKNHAPTRTLLTDKNRTAVNRIILGSVIHFKDMYSITIRLINPDDGKMLYATSAEYKEEVEIPRVCEALARDITDYLKK